LSKLETEHNSEINEHNSVKIRKKDGGMYKLKLPACSGDEYYVLQTYKVSDMEKVSIKDR